jgi:hypothetical protein
MELRENIKTSNFEDFKTVKPVLIGKFLLFQRPIEAVYGCCEPSTEEKNKEPFQPSLFKLHTTSKSN